MTQSCCHAPNKDISSGLGLFILWREQYYRESTPYQLKMQVFEHALTVWLFTASDHFTFVAPVTLFGVFGAFSGPALTTNQVPTTYAILERLPKVLVWTWMNTFVFALSNQSHAVAVEEDRCNKPWRPLPAARITLTQARRLLLISIPTVLAICYLFVGGLEESMFLFCLTWMYNDLGGADGHFVLRDLIISVAYTFYCNGALSIAAGFPVYRLSQNGYVWHCITGAVIFTTISIQDLKDTEGDLARGRSTAPLSVGDSTTRFSIGCFIVMWSLYCPRFWGNDWLQTLPLAAVGLLITLRLLRRRDRDADRLSWKIWSAWILAVYSLPAFSVCARNA